ncbi:uncharacterized protein Z518_08995 [Rhinocladiella mackenziei CBS 650.93]|uniref:Linalool dehydratase/isomerase domain-containing protein n=1 Tax=Rhinocladiella mackenziei CBS 650.93 TaxID=1442369 RepID=A0A0D2IXE2_9EURO|nr:uncharacterized protein Z518_08995 [Rhinocladiella mackenziei CBS 650.93]KIX01270.1 hypothetical protein Z518_08995 [Rhinocladiella mackenziei CBS 650.93]
MAATITTTTMSQFMPQSLPLDISKYSKLSAEQVGHLRHFHNLAFQPDGEWFHMGAQEPAQEFLDATAINWPTQLDLLTTTACRLFAPSSSRSFVNSFTKCFEERSGAIAKLRDPWADPVVRENIMYSGHLLLMTSLYAMLFDDDEFENPDSIVFKWDPLFYGFGNEIFSYDNRSLQIAIIKEMERNGWIIAMRYNDSRDGTGTVSEVLTKYRAAWDRKGMVGPNGLFVDMWMVKQDHVFPAADVAWTAWQDTSSLDTTRVRGSLTWLLHRASAFMNTWNSELVSSLYAKQVSGFITNISGQIRLQPPVVANHYRQITAESPTVSQKDALTKAISLAKADIISAP